MKIYPLRPHFLLCFCRRSLSSCIWHTLLVYFLYTRPSGWRTMRAIQIGNPADLIRRLAPRHLLENTLAVGITTLIILYSISGIAATQKNSTLTDPTRPPYYQGSTARIISKEDLKLTAIIMSQERRLAVVNDEIVKTGDKIGDITVVDIGKNFVKFHSASGYFTISLHSDID